MTGHEIECVVWCAHCGNDKYRVIRKPTGQNGVFAHEIQWMDTGKVERGVFKVERGVFVQAISDHRLTKVCADCDTNLSRKE